MRSKAFHLYLFTKVLGPMLAFSFLPFIIYSQITKEMARINSDSLQQILPELSGTDKIDALNKIAFKLCYKYPDSCISLANQAIRLSKSMDYKKSEAIGYFNLGNGYFFEDTPKLSVLNYLNALRIFDSIDPCMEMAYTYQVLAYLNWRAGRMEKSLQYTRYEIGISNQLSDYHYKCGAMTQASVYLTESFHFDSANIYLDSAIAIAESLHDTLLLTNAFFYKGYNAIKRYEYKYKEEDLIYCRECIHWYLKLLELNGGKSTKPSVYANLAASHLALGTREDSILCLKYTNIQKSIADTLSYLYFHNLNAYRRLGRLNADAGDYKGAIKLFMEGIDKANEARSRYSIKNQDNINPFYYHIAEEYYYEIMLGWMYARIYRAYKELGDFKKAHEYYVLWQESRDRVFLKDNKNLIAMLESESESEKTQNQIAELKRDKQINELKVAQSRNLNIGIGSVFVILFLLGLLFLRQNKLKNKHKNTILNKNFYGCK